MSSFGFAWESVSLFFNIRSFPTSLLFNLSNQAAEAGWITPLFSPSPANPEDQWQREISEKGEVSCPTCSVITRKTIVGLKKHMDVCQKVRPCFIQ